LYKLAHSKNIWARRTAIVCTYYFIKNGEVEDTFKIAEILLKDKHDIIHKATGSWLRTAGTKNKQELINFLDRFAATMPRVTLRYAIEHFDKKKQQYYLRMKI
jgi:3-methyladenine DNA glycosylase AlkD